MPDVILRSADPFCNSEEYLAALFAENEAVRAVNAVNLLRETAFAARNKCIGSTTFSFSAYLSADTSFWQHTKAFTTKMAALDAASKVTFFARQKGLAPNSCCGANLRITRVPSAVSFVLRQADTLAAPLPRPLDRA